MMQLAPWTAEDIKRNTTPGLRPQTQLPNLVHTAGVGASEWSWPIGRHLYPPDHTLRVRGGPVERRSSLRVYLSVGRSKIGAVSGAERRLDLFG